VRVNFPYLELLGLFYSRKTGRTRSQTRDT